MKFITLTVFSAFAVLISSADETASNFVVHGEDASIRDYPYMAKVWNLNWPACGGAILTQRSVLTAAHCFFEPVSRAFTVTVTVGSSHRNGQGGQRYSALRILNHPDYNATSLLNDVAVVRTTSRIVFSDVVQPIPLSNSVIGVAVEGVFTGWGFVSYGILPRRADLLQKMPYRTISNQQCREMYSVTHRAPFVVDQKLCILSGFRQSVCGGDSGSPLVFNGSVIGVVSWRTMPCGDGLPDVFIRISAVRNWILTVV